MKETGAPPESNTRVPWKHFVGSHLDSQLFSPIMIFLITFFFGEVDDLSVLVAGITVSTDKTN